MLIESEVAQRTTWMCENTRRHCEMRDLLYTQISGPSCLNVMMRCRVRRGFYQHSRLPVAAQLWWWLAFRTPRLAQGSDERASLTILGVGIASPRHLGAPRHLSTNNTSSPPLLAAYLEARRSCFRIDDLPMSFCGAARQIWLCR